MKRSKILDGYIYVERAQPCALRMISLYPGFVLVVSTKLALLAGAIVFAAGFTTAVYTVGMIASSTITTPATPHNP